MKSTTKRIDLDWSKLIGFNQVQAARSSSDKKRIREAIGAKIGGKVGGKVPPGA
jgi:hypothetical protein